MTKAIHVTHSQTDLDFRRHVLGHESAAVEYFVSAKRAADDGPFRLLTTGDYNQIVKVCGSLNYGDRKHQRARGATIIHYAIKHLKGE